MSLAIAATVFAVIFLAELPDKTALASLILGSHGRPQPGRRGGLTPMTRRRRCEIIYL
jgi:hypothetical protein